MERTRYAALVTVVTFMLCVSSAMMTGGKEKMSKNEADKDDLLTQALVKAIQQYNRRSNSMYTYGISEIKDLTRQVVQGFSYEATVTFAPTNCRKSSAISHECDVLTGDEMKQYGPADTFHVTMWVRAWLKPEDQFKITMKPVR